MKPKLIYVYIIALIVTAYNLYSLVATERELDAVTAKNITLQTELNSLHAQCSRYQAEIEELSAQLKEAQERQDKADRGGERLTSLGKWKVTGYCKCKICCGKWADNRPNGKVYGSSGIELIEGVSCAADLPIGTRLMIGGKVRTVHDRPTDRIVEANGGKIVDLYCGSHTEAWEVGNERVEVWEAK